MTNDSRSTARLASKSIASAKHPGVYLTVPGHVRSYLRGEKSVDEPFIVSSLAVNNVKGTAIRGFPSPAWMTRSVSHL